MVATAMHHLFIRNLHGSADFNSHLYIPMV